METSEQKHACHILVIFSFYKCSTVDVIKSSEVQDYNGRYPCWCMETSDPDTVVPLNFCEPAECNADCASCFSENFCTRCHPGHFLFRGKCETSCPNGLTANTALRECIGKLPFPTIHVMETFVVFFFLHHPTFLSVCVRVFCRL